MIKLKYIKSVFLKTNQTSIIEKKTKEKLRSLFN